MWSFYIYGTFFVRVKKSKKRKNLFGKQVLFAVPLHSISGFSKIYQER